MYDSQVKASTLITELQNTLDVAADIPTSMYASWLNELEQFVYTEIIKEQKVYNGNVVWLEDIYPNISTSVIDHPEDESEVRGSDVVAVYAKNTSGDTTKESYRQLIEVTPASASMFSDWYYTEEKKIHFKRGNATQIAVRIVYVVRPIIKTESNVAKYNVALPPEFMSLARAKLSAEAYKWVNEDGIAAKWMNDYNILLETFKQWISNKNPKFGWRA